MRKLIIAVWCFSFQSLSAQVCIELGQNPPTAFPICGSTSYSQSSVPICGLTEIPTPCTSTTALFKDKNPYWYRFTCYKTGTLGFDLLPNIFGDDYDWQIFDITGKNANDVYADKSLFVACNWSGESGRTGAGPLGTSVAVCDGYGEPTFSKMPDLVKGHVYLLLISHFTDTQSGYLLSFGGGTAVITDTTKPAITSITPDCSGQNLTIKFNKKLLCNSFTDFPSSEFAGGVAGVNFSSLSLPGCKTGFDIDSIILSTNDLLAPGNYTLVVKKGGDGNTLLDNCLQPMDEGPAGSFTINQLVPTSFDSIIAVGCTPTKLEAVFKKPLRCASVAGNGSDFVIDAASGVSITGATTICTNTTSYSITLMLSAPITTKGIFKITLVKGTDGNTIIDECGQETPVGETVQITTTDVVSAAIDYNIKYGCKADTVQFTNTGTNGVNTWRWKFNDRAGSAINKPVYVFSRFGPQVVRLFVSNNVCTDSTVVNFTLDNELKAAFTGKDLFCPKDDALFTDSSVGKINYWKWDFGNGNTSNLQKPPTQTFAGLRATTQHNIRLIVGNSYNCFDTAVKKITVLNSCYIAVASAFTPNGDGLNDYLYPLNAFKTSNLLFRVYNRVGQLIFETTDFTKKWDGTYKGVPQQSGTFVYTLQYTNTDDGKPYFLKGTSVLLR